MQTFALITSVMEVMFWVRSFICACNYSKPYEQILVNYFMWIRAHRGQEVNKCGEISRPYIRYKESHISIVSIWGFEAFQERFGFYILSCLW